MKNGTSRQGAVGAKQEQNKKERVGLGQAGRRQLAAALALLLLIMLVSLAYTGANSRRISAQTQSYISDTAERTAGRLEDFFADGQRHIRMAASLLEELGEENADAERLAGIAEESSFLRLYAADRDGHFLDDLGNTGECGDTEYFRKASQGETGIVFQSETSETGVPVVFYAPIRRDGEIVGVAAGFCGEEQIEAILTAKFFGKDARTVLCLNDGRVLAGFGSAIKGQDVPAYFGESGLVSEEMLGRIRQFFEEGEEGGACQFSYQTSQGEGNGCLLRLTAYPVTLLQTFPSGVISGMKAEANLAGFFLQGCLLLFFAVYVIWILRNSRQQKKQLADEREEAVQLLTGVHRLFTCFVVIDLKEGTYEYLEESRSHLDGIPSSGKYADLLASLLRLITAEEGEEAPDVFFTEAYIRQNLREDVPYLQYEYQVTRNGADVWENASILCFRRDAAGMPENLLVAVQDITASKREEQRRGQALQEAFWTAESASRAKSDFLSRMSHDIRTPMNAIMGMTAIATMHIGETDRVADCLKKIAVSSRHLLGLINEVLDMSKIESGRVSLMEEEFNLSETMENLMTIFHSQIAAKRQELSVHISNIRHEDVVGDPQRLQQVLVNILGNAVKFTPEGGRITLSIRENEEDANGNSCYEFVFEDNGIGMDEAFLAHIFEPFARAETQQSKGIEGTGLGMPIARNIARMMNGDIKVESALGKGSRFTVTVFLRHVREEEGKDVKLADLKVLVVDDDRSVCESTSAVLNEMGMVADWALSGEEAIERLTEEHEDFSAVILDWKMPGLGGVETARIIRERISDVLPIIILSAYDWSEIEKEAKEAGVDAFITKPLFKSRLLYVMKSVLGEKEQAAAAPEKLLSAQDYAGKRILLTEDNELNMEIGEELLTTAGFAVDKAYNGKEAVDRLLATPPGTYDLVLMDIQMPVMNGYEAARAIRGSGREDLKTLPVIAMTADAFVEDMRKAEAAGMNGHISKPIEIPKLMRMLEIWS